VTGIGTASVTHQLAISTVSAATAQASAVNPAGAPANSISAAAAGPPIRPIVDRCGHGRPRTGLACIELLVA
jgi:hypothetical protein